MRENLYLHTSKYDYMAEIFEGGHDWLSRSTGNFTHMASPFHGTLHTYVQPIKICRNDYDKVRLVLIWKKHLNGVALTHPAPAWLGVGRGYYPVCQIHLVDTRVFFPPPPCCIVD